MRNQIIIAVAAAVIFGAGGFFIGQKTARQTPARFAQAGAAAGQFAFRGGAVGGAGAARGGNNAVFGTVISKDENGITVQLGGPNATSTNGNASGTRIVLINGSTQVTKMASGSAADLSVGTGVTVMGTANSDGSLTAQSVQIRPVPNAR
jgi:hypothetical protein